MLAFDNAPSDYAHGSPRDVIVGLLKRARLELGVDLCFVGEMDGNHRTFRFVDGDDDGFGVQVGLVEAATGTYCRLMLDGMLPPVVPDTRADPRTAAFAITQSRDIGSFVGFPIVLPSGRIYGTLCALGHQARPDLDDRDLETVRFIAGLISEQLVREQSDIDEVERLRAEVATLLESEGALRVLYQPIVDLESGRVAGYEALARFSDGRSPAEWFDDAWRAGLGIELELKALAVAVRALDALPEDTYLSLNVSPRTFLSRDFASEEIAVDLRRLVMEITEHAAIEDYEVMQQALVGLLDRGVRLAIDDAGAGYSTLNHIMKLAPDIIKLDMVFTRGIDEDPVRRSLTAALVVFARETDITLVAEGVETAQELETLRRLGVEFAQGYLLGRPAPLG